MNNNDLLKICISQMKSKNVFDKEHQKRFELEWEEMRSKGELDYFIKLYQNQTKFAFNENNLLIPYLLDIVPDYNIKESPKWHYGDWPDCDLDYIDGVRQYLKEDFAPKTFGQEYICNIASYNTFGIKGALKDVARIFSLDHKEVEIATKSLKDKDEDGKPLTWDQSLELFDEFKSYCVKYPEVAEAAKKMVGRVRSLGQHASGLIVASVPIHNYVPLVRGKEGRPASAWIEGLHGTDLSTVGFVKFDFLGLDGNQKLAMACKMVSEATKDLHICALPGQPNWSDTSYLNDPKALAMANKGDLRMIFQFDGSPGIRRLAKEGGVNCFEDLVAYTSLYRPSTLKLGVHKKYITRKKGLESYEIHPALKDGPANLSFTYGIQIYQEQCLRILNSIGGIPMRDCEIVRKAISKKKIDQFQKYKEAFIENGQKLNITKKDLEKIWMEVEAFSGYGFNHSILKGTKIINIKNNNIHEKKIEDFTAGDKVLCINESGDTVETEVVALHDHGILEGYEITLDDGYKITCTMNHKFLTKYGQKSLKEIIGNNYSILCDSNYTQKENYAQEKNRRLEDSMREKSAYKKSDVYSRQKLSILQRCCIYDGEMVGTLRSKIQNSHADEKTPTIVLNLSKSCLEVNGNRWKNNYNTKQNSLWNDFRYTIFGIKTSKRMCEMFGNQTAKYNCQESKTQSIRKSPIGIIQVCTDNICSARNSSSKSRTIENMEREKSRKISEMYRSSMGFPEKTIQNGNMDGVSIRLEYGKNSMWRKTKTSGFCQRQYLDRNRWILPFLRKPTQKRSNTNIITSTDERCHIEYGSNSKKKHYFTPIEYGMFCNFNRGDENRVVGVISEHAPIKDTGRLVSRKIIRVVSVGKQRMYDLEVACSTHNFLLPNGVITSNSHAVAYTYVSSRMLYLKAHYPAQFVCSMFTNTKASGPKDYQKLKEYKADAIRLGVKLEGVNVNKSKSDFCVNPADNKIYYGFGKIKDIGDDAAKRIEEMQPYTGFIDFLKRFGTNAKVVQALLALRCFNEKDPVTLYKFYECYKAFEKKERARIDRYEKMKTSLENDLKEALASGNIEKELEIQDKLQKCIANKEKKDQFLEVPTLDNFCQNMKFKVNDTFIELLNDSDKAALYYYGYVWQHPLEKCEGYEGLTFESLRDSEETSGEVEVVINEITEKKGPKASYYSAYLEDGIGEKRRCTIWADDFDRFSMELKQGNMVRMHLEAPKPPYPTYGLYQFPGGRYRKPKREHDHRVILLKDNQPTINTKKEIYE